MPVVNLYVNYWNYKMLITKAHIELFHIMFLRQFSSQIDHSLYAIKGGCNLRFFFNSVRYSEDLDIDIQIIQKLTLENKVNKILTSPLLLKSLQGHGVTNITSTSPKQTQTTQRWKIQVYTENSEMPLHTKIEFSRRNTNLDAELGVLSRQICQLYTLPPLRLPHYGLQEACIQKILALANRSFTQARDIFDLYHLLHIGTPIITMKKQTLRKAEDAILSIDYNDYKSQVISFLEPTHQQEYGDKSFWDIIANEVFQYLSGLES